MSRSPLLLTFGLTILLLPHAALAVSAETGVDVGPGEAGADAGADGAWNHAETETKVGPNGSMGRAFAVGAGPDGLSLSHSIGVNNGNSGFGHNFNMTIGPNGTHSSSGGVASQGNGGRVIAGGSTQGGSRLGGGSTVGGFGNRTNAWTNARTNRRGGGYSSAVMPSNSASPSTNNGGGYSAAVMPTNYRANNLGGSNKNSNNRNRRISNNLPW